MRKLSKHMENAKILWPQMISGILKRRYKRFLTEIILDSGETITAHCPNSGSMKTCCEPGRQVYVSIEDSPKRKLKYTWQLIRMSESLVGVNTLVPNKLMRRAFEIGSVPGFEGNIKVDSEVKINDETRLDLALTYPSGGKCYIEVKNCTLVTDRVARFPDAVTLRGAKHLETLEALIAQGHRCVMIFLIQRMDADRFSVAQDIDPNYGIKFRRAIQSGVEMFAFDVVIV
jgi:sugar fermentation stimulation protein A